MLIVGGGNSGAQILAEVSKVAHTKWVTLDEPTFLPDDIDGGYLFNEATQKYLGKTSEHSKNQSVSLADIVMVENVKDVKALKSEIVQLLDPKTKKVKRTIWLRTFKETKQDVYSGVYETSTIPNGTTCIKAKFPLPNGHATVILTPNVGKHGELILKSSGENLRQWFLFSAKGLKGTFMG